MDSEWRWSRWELVSIQHEDDVIVVDAIDLDPDLRHTDETLRTLAFVPTQDGMQLGSSDLRETLTSWVESDDVCDVLQRDGDEHSGALMLLQHEQLLLFPTRSTGEEHA